MIPERLNYGKLRLILIELLKANKPINDMITILETIDEIGTTVDIKDLSSIITDRI